MSSENTSQPTNNNSARRLVAILFADIVGYTAMMQSDEKKSRVLLDKFLSTVKEVITQHNGQVINNYGDGCVCIFESAVSAVYCSKDLQTKFQEEPKVPVRIGLHSGDVFFKDDNVFGDSVNIASRIESMGVPGAVLVSKRVRDVVKNQSDLLLTSLGFFDFKNVEEPKEVFALANNGFVVPNRSDLSGKFKEKQTASNWVKYLIPILLLIAVSLSLWFFKNQKSDQALTLHESNYIEPLNTPLSKDDRDKSVAVMAFDNLTKDDDLDIYGQMISDWVTRGLLNSESAKVIKLEHVQSPINQKELQDPSPDFVEQTGVDLIISGSYYNIENNLIAVCNITELSSGEVLHTFDIEKPKGQSIDLINELTDRIVGFWVVMDESKFSNNPPKFEAYKEYLEGNQLYQLEPKKAENHFRKAFEIDSTFYAPLFRLQSSYYRFGDKAKEIKEISDYLEKKKSNFTKWEKLSFELSKAFNQRDWLLAANYSSELLEMDPADSREASSAAYLYNQVNYPRKALETLLNFDERYIPNNKRTNSISQICHAYLRMGEFQKVDSIVSNYQFSKMYIPMAAIHIEALIKQKDFNRFESFFNKYNNQDLYNPIGLKELPDHLWNLSCANLYLGGHDERLKKQATLFDEWLSSNETSPYPHLAPDVFNNRPLRKEEAQGYVQYYLGNYEQAIQFWQKENIPESNWADQIEKFSRLGSAFGLLGNEMEANNYLELIDGINDNDPDVTAHKQYYSARILTQINEKTEALNKLAQSFNNGFIFFRPMVFGSDPFLKPLLSDQRFIDFIEPKG